MDMVEGCRSASWIDVPTEEKDKGVVVYADELKITWGNDSRYWRMNETERTAELITVWWLQVTGSVEMNLLEANTRYKLQFNIMMKLHASGWDIPVYIMVIPGKGKSCIWRKVYLNRITKGISTGIPSCVEFTTPSSVDDDKVSFGLFEIWGGNLKQGLVIEKVVISKVTS
ncbi:hypothetical protein LUZ63_008469 [Rhynchospora breviuscula]|uniref:Uncharacterized protein n=1 Tax=Rhynchospora breviuscula TaxID=2022672 RepID=A0A9Q0HVE1_9POAL|nr:hypothetical protein LUZ63_008469 [Rhynchospora breviuscula]